MTLSHFVIFAKCRRLLVIHGNLPSCSVKYRSPLLACTFGLGIALRYIATTSEDIIIWEDDEGTVRDNRILDLVGFPALVAALIALVMTAVRLLVMYNPSTRARWGRYIKERSLFRALGFALVLMEVAVWSAASTQGVTRWDVVWSVSRNITDSGIVGHCICDVRNIFAPHS